MLVKLNESVHLDGSPKNVWKLLRDTPRLAGLLPGVESVKPVENCVSEAYTARVSDKIGPFKITMNVEVRLGEMQESCLMKMVITGADGDRQNRLTGTLHLALAPEPSGTKLDFEASVEVLGKLASLGAIPIRRRTSQVFAEFARNIQGQFAQEHP